MHFSPSQNEKIILHALQHGNATDESASMNAAELRERCAAAGLANHSAFEFAVMNLIDHDLIEYEMDDDLQASQFWLLDSGM